MQIQASQTLADIQKVFNDTYPYLKLEFFNKPHGVGDGSPKKDMMNTDLSIDECSSKEKSGNINIDSSVKASEIEQSFMDVFGLSVQVFRLSGDVWLETTTTDNWTLEEQNQSGKERATV
ncbi:MAG: hypothetical protein HKO56_04110 [Bacteroidia bacterium]|nr:hypothetical protein [Bacteroidia bacterium]NNM15821.1 hypothetical protein [Bacteroidia bacterium]